MLNNAKLVLFSIKLGITNQLSQYSINEPLELTRSIFLYS